MATDLTPIRLHVLERLVETAKIPTAHETAAALGLTVPQAIDAYRSLHEGRVGSLEPGDPTRFRMINPFSAVPTPFTVEAGGRSYFGNCIFDALGIISFLGGTGTVKTTCPDCKQAMTLSISNRRFERQEGVVHFSVPAAHWWDDIVYT
jgi:hypothetical protein